jgi:glutathione gamma-glutamylcysteinyltransferase
MSETLYRRPLPPDAIAFSSADGRQVFAEALASGGLTGYFPLAEQFHTQSDPAFCGLGSLVVALNALGIDPGRLWKGPWRWFAEELLDCCVPLSEVRERGLDVGQLACLARCNGADVELAYGDATNLASFRSALALAAAGDGVLIVSYDRSALGQTGSGHFSPIGGYHQGRDLALVLDVARFKYPPHWLSVERLWQAMQPIDPVTGRARGFMILRARAQGIALGFSVRCEGESWQGLTERLSAIVFGLGAATEVATLARAVLPLVSHLELRVPSASAHREALANARAALQGLALYREVSDAIGAAHAETVTLLLLTIDDLLSSRQREALEQLTLTHTEHPALTAELSNVRAQLSALWSYARVPDACLDRSPSP